MATLEELILNQEAVDFWMGTYWVEHLCQDFLNNKIRITFMFDSWYFHLFSLFFNFFMILLNSSLNFIFSFTIILVFYNLKLIFSLALETKSKLLNIQINIQITLMVQIPMIVFEAFRIFLSVHMTYQSMSITGFCTQKN